MPHQCVRCGKFYPDASKEILEGCSCGSRYFFFMKQESIEELKKETADLTEDDREEITRDVEDIVGLKDERPVILDLESIRIKEPGKFEIDLVNIFKRKPLVYKIEEGKYIIDIASSFQMRKGKTSKELRKLEADSE
jgi:predicted  nucleic acid-binding Zn-ribbon protein